MTDAATERAEEKAQYLTFFVQEEEYAIEILRVKEILRYETLTRVPMTPQYIRGVMNVRGSVVPVIDLGVKFGLESSPVTKWTCIVVVQVLVDGEEVAFGLLADAVSQVVNLPKSEVEPPPAFGTTARADCLKGMGRLGAKFALILDIDRVLATDEVLSQAALASAGVAPGGSPMVGSTAEDTDAAAEGVRQ